jgi:O-antigen/teichoic acid export membrane protein
MFLLKIVILYINTIILKLKNNSESVISIISRVITAGSFYVLTFLSSRHFNPEDFANWSLFITCINLLPLLNFGISTGLVNRIAFNNSSTNVSYKENILIVNASLKVQIIISIFLGVIVFILMSINSIKSIKIILENKLSIFILLTSLPFQFYSSILYSYKKINLANYISIFQNIFLLLVAFLIFGYSGSLNIFILYYSLAYTSLQIISFVYSLIVNNINILYSFRDIKYISIISIQSVSFWGMSFFSNILSTAQVFFVSFLFGIQAVPNFFLFQRLFSIINTFHLAFLSPYTVRFIELSSNFKWRDLKFLLNSLVIKFTLGLYMTLGLTIYFFHPLIIEVWTHKYISDYKSALIFLFIFLLTSFGNVYSVFLNSLGHFKIQIYFSSISFISFLIFLYFLKDYLGSVSVACATIPSTIITLIIMINFVNKLLNKKIII